jgi:ATP-dependent Clp protease ATP-binding subunit ClpA
MVFFLVTFVFRPEFLELLDDLIIFADLLVDDKQHGIDREYNSQQNP